MQYIPFSAFVCICFVNQVTAYSNSSHLDLDRSDAEIYAWNAQLNPTQAELQKRLSFVDLINSTVLQVRPDANVFMFGSSVNGLGTAYSDTDLVVFTNEPPLTFRANRLRSISFLEQLRERLKHKMTILDLLSAATVPILRVQSETGISVDISANSERGLKTTKIIIDYGRCNPILMPLTRILKTLLAKRELNKILNAGIQSITISFLVSHFLNTKLQQSKSPMKALLNFLYFYGKEMDTAKEGIDMKTMDYICPSFLTNSSRLVVLDPIEHSLENRENLTKDSAHYPEIRAFFAETYDRLVSGESLLHLLE